MPVIERCAQDTFDAIDALLHTTRPEGGLCGPQPFDRAGYRVEVLGRDAILWRGKRIVAALWHGKIVWVCNGHTYDPTAWQRGEDGAKNELLSALLAARWPRNHADHTVRSEKPLREFRARHPSTPHNGGDE